MGSCSSKPEPPPASSTALATPSTEAPAAEKPAEKPTGGWFDTASSDATESSGEKAPAERRPSLWALVRQKSAENLVEPFSGSPIGKLFKEKREYAKTRLADLREHLDSMPNHPAHACADEMLCRHIESNTTVKGVPPLPLSFSVSLKAAADGLAATMKWRKDYGADNIKSCKHCDVDPFAHCFFSIGRDRRGWEVSYACSGRARNKDHTSIAHHLVAFMESVFNKPNPPTHFIILLDLHGFGIGELDPRVAIYAITILLKHYPDRVAQVCLLDSPWIFKGMWNFIKHAADPLSQQKAAFLTRGADMSEYMSTYLHPDQAAFIREMLELRARPKWDAFCPSAHSVRVSLGPKDAFCKEVGKPKAEVKRQTATV